MEKYMIKPEFKDNQIITKTSDGTEILVTAQTFNDYFGDLMFKNGQHHLLKINPQWSESENTEKKTFVLITDEHILLTSTPEQIVEKLQNTTVNEPILRRKPGRQPKAKI